MFSFTVCLNILFYYGLIEFNEISVFFIIIYIIYLIRYMRPMNELHDQILNIVNNSKTQSIEYILAIDF